MMGPLLVIKPLPAPCREGEGDLRCWTPMDGLVPFLGGRSSLDSLFLLLDALRTILGVDADISPCCLQAAADFHINTLCLPISISKKKSDGMNKKKRMDRLYKKRGGGFSKTLMDKETYNIVKKRVVVGLRVSAWDHCKRRGGCQG